MISKTFMGVDLSHDIFITNRNGERIPLVIEETESSPGSWTKINGYLVGSPSLIPYRKSTKIKDVIFNNPATIVFWSDGSKTVVKCQEGDTYDAEKGLALCIAKKYLGNKGNFNEEFKKWIKGEKKEEKKEENNSPFPVGTKIEIIETIFGCTGAEGLIGVVTKDEHTQGLFSEDPGYNVRTSDNEVWRINPGAKVRVFKEV